MITKLTLFIIPMVMYSFMKIKTLKSNDQKKEATLFGSIMAITLVVGSLLILNVNIPSFIIPFKILFEPIGKKILGG